MDGSATGYLDTIWNRFILLTDQSPRSIFAAILAILTSLVGVAIISLFSRLSNLKSRNRQLTESVEALSALLEETRSDLDAKISALSAPSSRAVSAPVIKEKDRELPVALMREELVSLQLDMRAPEEHAEIPLPEEKI
jgi:hypothetical protein